MNRIVVRRKRIDTQNTVNDLEVPVTDRTRTAMSLKEILDKMQRERGRGPWSDADPEVLVDGCFAGRLRRGESIEDLMNHIVEQVFQIR